MKAASFDYVRAESLEHALEAIAVEGTRALAGGQSLVPLMARRRIRPARICDLNGLTEIAGVEVTEQEVVIGAMTRQRDLELHREATEAQPVLAAALRLVGFVSTRHRGTIGGSLCHADPCGELPAVAALLDARVTLRGPAGRREVSARELVVADFRIQREQGELLTEVRFPVHPEQRHGAVKLRPGQDRTLGSLVSYGLDAHGRIEDPRVALFGTGALDRRLPRAERVLWGEEPGSELFAEAAAVGTADLEPLRGALASPGYRRRLARAALGRALEQSMGAAHD